MKKLIRNEIRVPRETETIMGSERVCKMMAHKIIEGLPIEMLRNMMNIERVDPAETLQKTDIPDYDRNSLHDLRQNKQVMYRAYFYIHTPKT